MENVVETENLTKQYRTSLVVDNINLHVPKGKIYGLLGRNGAGKTTLMKMMLQLVCPTKGTIRLLGMDCRENADKLYHKIGSIIETPGFYGNLTAYENLHLLRRLRGQKQTDGISKALEVVGLQGQHTKPFSEYSLGMKQRLGIAAAIMHEPELLILDEPINGLDPIGIAEIRSFLSDLGHTKGTTILISSHVLSEIEQIADIIGIMHEGHLIEEVNMAELQKCKYTEFDVSDVIAASKLLEDVYRISDYAIQGDTVKVFDFTHHCGEINRTFIENGLTVTRLCLCEGYLEDYFSDLIGGGGIA